MNEKIEAKLLPPKILEQYRIHLAAEKRTNEHLKRKYGEGLNMAYFPLAEHEMALFTMLCEIWDVVRDTDKPETQRLHEVCATISPMIIHIDAYKIGKPHGNK